MTLALAYNTTDVSVVVDDDGRSIGGRLWGVVDTTERLGRRELAARRIRLADEKAARESKRTELVDAITALDERRRLTEAASRVPKDDLIAALPPTLVADLEVGGDDKPAKADLVDAAVAAGVDVTASKTPTSKSSRSGDTPKGR